MFFFLVFFVVLAEAFTAVEFPNGYEIADHSVSFESFTSKSCSDGHLICTGSVTSSDGFLSLTPELTSSSNSIIPQNQVGRVVYKHPFHVWSSSILTQFTFRIIPSANASGESAEGMSFIMASDNSSSPANSYGSYLGIMDPSREGVASGQLSVEFDTYKNSNNSDVDGNHVAINTKGLINPVASKSLSDREINLKSGRDIMIKITIRENLVEVCYWIDDQPAMYNILSTTIDILKTLPSSVYVGFTASTGVFTQRHQLLNWNFHSYPIPK